MLITLSFFLSFFVSHLEMRPHFSEPINTYIQSDSVKGKMISFQTPDGKTASAFEIRSKIKSNKYLLVFHEWWGLNDYIKAQATEYFIDLENVNVLAIDLYDGKETTKPNEASRLSNNIESERAESIINGALNYAGDKAEVATLGWCFGGKWALQASIIAGKKSKATVIYYGMPETDIKKLKKLSGPVLGIFGTKDRYINPDVVAIFVNNMKKAGKKLNVKSFQADHAFANSNNPNYSPEAAVEARKLSLEFLKKHLE